ncbi:PTS system mannose/fructose/sorbose family transporter subunit IID [Absicoccus intestinalis]|uniref:PTS system mannose/fructose/sorbose family transporter subunit IID n=1 Tax=Absicoccus intestinalis TaxID=2926319 RepID=A0ABU4WIG4_9FIRM|nr:PTS system mannose/fructose/sorbose family transporter subunit IID [Absicoccus sp. CLA-KB-P134]MDX8416345.1 PTS system mannose/fructose/sorbose family transporter subunit IID [Absicoccus sp. CLA-KB-P134]
MTEEKKITLTKKDINRAIRRWYISTEMSLNYERMQSIAYTYSIMPALKKLYPNEEDYIAALQRHLELFNTNATAGGLILGTTLAMEEEKANHPDKIPGSAIVSIKTGLMGPVAAFGDSFSAGTITTLFILASCSLAKSGSIAGFWLLLLGTMYTLGELIVLTKLTYQKGRSAIKDVLSSSLMTDVIEGANILGMTMMGALTASMVNLSVAITAHFDKATLSVQDKIDGIMPGILSLSVLLIYYFLISKKHVSVAKLVLITLVFGIVTAAIGLF